jgi:hypothetical protein
MLGRFWWEERLEKQPWDFMIRAEFLSGLLGYISNIEYVW